MSVVRYGATRGARRLLDAFAAAGVPTTWFAPGQAARDHAAVLAEVAAAGHGLGFRGDRLERLDSLEPGARAAVLRRGAGALAAAAGRAPAGFRLAAGEWPPGLTADLLDLGCAWSSSLPGDDVPFTLPAGDGRRLVEVGMTDALDDRAAFFWNLSPPFPAGQSRIPSYQGVLENWLLELEGHRRAGGCFVVRLHPEICGTPGRISLVRDLLAAVTGHDDAWVTTCDRIAAWWAGQHPDNADVHPIEVFLRAGPGTAL
jgi:peptidoglycan/xylan/chitin deacetylase (PgdA/CDA1 family)